MAVLGGVAVLEYVWPVVGGGVGVGWALRFQKLSVPMSFSLVAVCQFRCGTLSSFSSPAGLLAFLLPSPDAYLNLRLSLYSDYGRNLTQFLIGA